MVGTLAFLVTQRLLRLLGLVPKPDAKDVELAELRFVPAPEQHEYIDITDDLTLIMIVTPPYHCREQTAAAAGEGQAANREPAPQATPAGQ